MQLVVVYAPSAGSAGTVPYLDKAVHLIVFAAAAATAVRTRLPLAPVIGALLAHAVVSEVIQAYALPARSGDVLDALADMVGTLAGLFVAQRWWRRDSLA